MTPAQIATSVRYRTRTSTSTFLDADMLFLLNERIDEIAQAILRSDEDIFLIPQTDDLVASSITAREYAMPSDILSRIKRVEGKLDGTDFIKLTEIDITQYDKTISTEADITSNFSNLEGEAYFDILRKSIFIYSGTLTAVTDGLKVWVNTWPAHVTTDMTGTTDLSVDPSTTTHGIPRAFHGILVTGVVIDYKESREKPIPLSERELSYNDDLEKAVATLKHGNLDREVIGSVPFNDGSQF